MTKAVARNAVAPLVAAFEALDAGGLPPWALALRKEGIARFAALGFPTTRLEAWRFTNVAPIAEAGFAHANGNAPVPTRQQVRSLEICEAHRHLAVFVNGRFAPDLSSIEGLPPGVVVGSIAASWSTSGEVLDRYLGKYASMERSAFVALNGAFLHDGALVYVPANVRMDEPVQLLFLSAPGAEPTVSHPRSLIVAERMARVAVVETYGSAGSGPYWTNAVTEVVAKDGARIDAYRIQREDAQAYHTGATFSDQGRDSTVTLHPIVFGAALSRHDIVSRLGGENGHCTMNGLYILGGQQHADHHTTMDHASPHCESHEYFNGVLDERSHGVFTGRIIVRPGAQRTDSKQTNNNLVLSGEARADSQPQLEIYADDVKCTHGATLGPIDSKAMFYLTSRGISAAEARSLLTYGFGAEIIDRMEIAPLQAQLDRMIRQRILGSGQPSR